MPLGDGTGPSGQGRGTGRGMRGSDLGKNTGRGRMGWNRPGAGPVGNCICPSCGMKVPHQQGMPCYSAVCPDCGTEMVREWYVIKNQGFRRQ